MILWTKWRYWNLVFKSLWRIKLSARFTLKNLGSFNRTDNFEELKFHYFPFSILFFNENGPTSTRNLIEQNHYWPHLFLWEKKMRTLPKNRKSRRKYRQKLKYIFLIYENLQLYTKTKYSGSAGIFFIIIIIMLYKLTIIFY